MQGPFNLGRLGGFDTKITVSFSQLGLDPTSQHTLVLKKSNDIPNWTSSQGNVSYFNIDFIK
jgi:hypothetical protein